MHYRHLRGTAAHILRMVDWLPSKRVSDMESEGNVQSTVAATDQVVGFGSYRELSQLHGGQLDPGFLLPAEYYRLPQERS